MRIPFWPKRRPPELVVTFTQEIDLEAVASGAPVGASRSKLAIVCPCGGTMHNNAPWVITKPNSVTQAYACNGCGGKVDVVYTYEASTPESIVTDGWVAVDNRPTRDR